MDFLYGKKFVWSRPIKNLHSTDWSLSDSFFVGAGVPDSPLQSYNQIATGRRDADPYEKNKVTLNVVKGLIN